MNSCRSDMEINEEKRMLLKLRDQLDQANRLRWFCEDKVGRLIEENKKLNVENGELQLAIARLKGNT